MYGFKKGTSEEEMEKKVKVTLKGIEYEGVIELSRGSINNWSKDYMPVRVNNTVNLISVNDIVWLED